MATTSDRKFKLKLLIDKKSQEVVFAEVGKDVVDFLLSLLSLPIGSVTELLTDEKSTFKPLRNMYCSWEQLDHSFLSSLEITPKRLFPVISPKSSSNFALPLSSASSAIAKEYVYKLNCNCNYFTDVAPSVIGYIYCKSCRSFVPYTTLSYVGPSVTKEAVERDGYVKDGVTYFVCDDLSVVPMKPFASIFESIKFLNLMGYKDLSLVEEKTVSLNDKQGLELLETSFKSKNVLTDMFLPKKKWPFAEEAN